MKIKKLLGLNGFFMINKSISFQVGIEAALLLAYLIDKMDSFEDSCTEREGRNWFFRTSSDIESETTLTYSVQKTCIMKLENLGFINTKLMGIPRKLYFTINENHILENIMSINGKNLTITLGKPEDTYNEELINEELINKEQRNEKKENFSAKKSVPSLFGEMDDFKATTKPQHSSNSIRPKKLDQTALQFSYGMELEGIVQTFNLATGSKVRSYTELLENYHHWRQLYSVEEIKASIMKIPESSYWHDKMTLNILFRQKNTAKENVNYISELLNLRNFKKKTNEELFNDAILETARQIMEDDD